jgi:phosphatidylglycerophosphatase C
VKRSIAFFDFDGTITTKDTMLELIKYHHGPFKYLAGFVVLSPLLVLMKAGIVSNHYAKEKMLSYFFGGMDIAKFNSICAGFEKEVIPSLIRPKAMERIQELRKMNVEIVVVSASAEQWVRGWCDRHGITLLASCLETRNGKVTGQLDGKNCHGEEKVKRIRDLYNLEDYGMIACFGDTKGDKPMLSLGNETFYKPFR